MTRLTTPDVHLSICIWSRWCSPAWVGSAHSDLAGRRKWGWSWRSGGRSCGGESPRSHSQRTTLSASSCCSGSRPGNYLQSELEIRNVLRVRNIFSDLASAWPPPVWAPPARSWGTGWAGFCSSWALLPHTEALETLSPAVFRVTSEIVFLSLLMKFEKSFSIFNCD